MIENHKYETNFTFKMWDWEGSQIYLKQWNNHIVAIYNHDLYFVLDYQFYFGICVVFYLIYLFIFASWVYTWLIN